MGYHIIIAGGGMAGLSCWWHLKQSALAEAYITIVEPSEKTHNDRTWCYWEAGVGDWDHLTFRTWNNIRIVNDEGAPQTLSLGEYKYKMIRGADFYKFVLEAIAKDPSTRWVSSAVKSIQSKSDQIIVATDREAIAGDVVFNSIPKPISPIKNRHYLLQHFYGQVVHFHESVFDASVADLMRFDIDQHDECRFIYVLPFSEKEALIELTVFSEKPLQHTEYLQELRSYIDRQYQGGAYNVIEEERGVIPMTDHPFTQFESPRHIRIGTAGGFTRPATGYTFHHTQKRLKEIIRHFSQTKTWVTPTRFSNIRSDFYAAVLLNVIAEKRMSAPKIFWDMYRKNPVDTVFQFLDGQSTVSEEIKVMANSHIPAFTKATLAILRKRLLGF